MPSVVITIVVAIVAVVAIVVAVVAPVSIAARMLPLAAPMVRLDPDGLERLAKVPQTHGRRLRRDLARGELIRDAGTGGGDLRPDEHRSLTTLRRWRS